MAGAASLRRGCLEAGAEEFADRLRMLDARASGLAIHAFIHREYTGAALADLPGGVRYYELTRR